MPAIFRRRTSDYDAASNRNQQRRNHGDQPIADGENGVGFQRFLEGNALLEDADEKSCDDVDGRNQNGGQRIALVEAGAPSMAP